MGLAIARGVLAVERGRISAENCADGGARFTMSFRRRCGESIWHAFSSSTTMSPIQRAVAPLLRSRGYEVDVVGTGATR